MHCIGGHRRRAPGELHDAGAEPDALGLGGDAGQRRDGVGPVGLGRPHRVEAEPLGLLDQVDRQLELRARVADGQSELHRSVLLRASREATSPRSSRPGRPRLHSRRRATFVVVPQQVVLITGASRGFGAAAARKIAGRGHIVVATMRDPDRDGPAVRAGLEDLIQTVRLDVTDTAEVDAVVAATLERHGRIDVVVNNAGYGLYGPAECGSEEQLWRQLDTNTFGPWRIDPGRAALDARPAPGQDRQRHVAVGADRVADAGPLRGHQVRPRGARARACGSRSARSACRCACVEPGMFASDWQTGEPRRRRRAADGTRTASWSPTAGRLPRAAATRPGAGQRRRRPRRHRRPRANPCRCAGRSATTPSTRHPDPGRRSPTRSGTQLCRSGALGPWRLPLHPDRAAAGRPRLVERGERRARHRRARAGFGAAAARELARARQHRRRHDARPRPRRQGGRRRLRGPHPPGPPRRHRSAGQVGRASPTRSRRFGRVDALVNNAGYGLFGAQEDLSDDETRRQFDTNFVGQWRMVRAVAPAPAGPGLRQDRQRLVAVGPGAEPDAVVLRRDQARRRSA